MKIPKSVMFFTVFLLIISLLIFGDELPIESTISMNTGRLDKVKNFHATELNNDRTLYVYLPPSYKSELNKQYPVMYVQDGVDYGKAIQGKARYKAMYESGYKPVDELAISVVPGGTHSEASWAKRVDDILLFYYGHTQVDKDMYVMTFE